MRFFDNVIIVTALWVDRTSSTIHLVPPLPHTTDTISHLSPQHKWSLELYICADCLSQKQKNHFGIKKNKPEKETYLNELKNIENIIKNL